MSERMNRGGRRGEQESYSQSPPVYGYPQQQQQQQPLQPQAMMRQVQPFDASYGGPAPPGGYPAEYSNMNAPPPAPIPHDAYDVPPSAGPVPPPMLQHQQSVPTPQGPPPPPQQQQQYGQGAGAGGGGGDYHRGGGGRGHRGGPGGGDHAQGGGGSSNIPDDVVEYLRYFKRCVEDQNVPEIRTLYEYGFSDLTDRFYRDRFWPDGDRVAQLVGNDSEIFLLLYRELYYRYLYAKIQRGPSMEHRWHSYHNYQALFGSILNAYKPISLNLPNQWLWDIVDEFVYQFQSFCQYKANLAKRTNDELEELRQMENQMWNLYPVMNILYSLVKKSQIIDQLCAMKKGAPLDFVDEFGAHPLYFRLGYFSLIGLLRLHTLLGDYFQALKAVSDLDFDPKGLYNTVPSCLVTLHYYVGFCHMMMRHYQDAIRIFVDCLLFIQRTRNMNQQQQQQKSWQYDVISKTNDQLYHLLAICLSLQPQRIDESVQSQLTEKMSEKMSRMQRGEISEFENVFTVGCPKFLAPTIPDTSTTPNTNFAKEPSMLQIRVFMEEIKQQALIPVLRGYLKLYTTMPVPKLASFMEKEEPELLNFLLSFKHKMCNVTKDDDKPEDESAPIDLDFYVDGDMIVIADTKVARRYGEYFIRHIQKLIELNKNLKKVKTRGGPAAIAGGKA